MSYEPLETVIQALEQANLNLVDAVRNTESTAESAAESAVMLSQASANLANISVQATILAAEQNAQGGGSARYQSLYSLCQDAGNFVEGQVYETVSFYNGLMQGGYSYVWLGNTDKSLANGGTIIDPSTLGALTEYPDFTRMESYLQAQGTGLGVGCLVVLDNDSVLTVEMFGGIRDQYDYDVRGVFYKIMDNIPSPNIKLYAGTYYVKGGAIGSTPINLTDHAILKGAGMFQTTIRNTDNTSASRIPVGTYGTTGVTIRDFGIDGNNERFDPGYSDSQGDGFDAAENAKDLTVENIYVWNTLGEGIDIDGATGVYVNNIIAKNCGGNGLHISHHTPAPQICNVSNVYVENCAHLRGAKGDERTGGVLLRGQNMNLSNIIVRNCYKGLWNNGLNLHNTDLSPINVTNLQISGSAFEDIGQDVKSSGLNITNFHIKRSLSNPNKRSILSKSSDILSLSDGSIYGKALIEIGNLDDTEGTRVSSKNGFTLHNIIASETDLHLATSDRFRITSNGFKSINLYRGVKRGVINSNVVEGSITSSPSSSDYQGKIVITGNVSASIDSNLKTNIRVLVENNLEG